MKTRALNLRIKAAVLFVLVSGLVSCGGQSIGPASQSGGGGGNDVPVSPTPGEYLWELSKLDGNLYVSTIDESSGQLGNPQVAGSVPCQVRQRNRVAFAPSRKFVFVTGDCYAGGRIDVFSVDGPGVTLREIPQSPFYEPGNFAPSSPANLVAITIDPSGSFLYALDASGVIVQFWVNGDTGELTFNTTTQVSSFPLFVVVSPQGHFLYVHSFPYPGNEDEILAYSIGSAGNLSPVPGSPFAVPTSPLENVVNGFVVTSDEKYLYASLGGSGIDGFAIDSSTGALSLVSGSPFANFCSPCSSLSTQGKFLYSNQRGFIVACTIDGGTGVLTVIPNNLSFSGTAAELALAPSGRFLFASTGPSFFANNPIQGFSIDPATGNLVPLAGSPFPGPHFNTDIFGLDIP
jgi:lactonase family protein with 7-bladed beta-propeller